MGWSRLKDIENFKDGIINDACTWYAKHKTAFWSAYAVTLIAYSYFFTTMGFSNHTFPQVWTYTWPSYRTTQEGRWFSDLLLWLLGGAGVSSSQMYIAAGLHIINAIIIAEIVGVEGKLSTFMAAAFLSVYPAFCDRYGFPGSQIPFVIADTFAVLGVLVLSRQKTAWKALAGASLLFLLCLADYQPAIALAAFLVLAHCVLLAVNAQNGSFRGINTFPVRRLATAAAALTLGGAGYFATMKITMTISLGSGARSHLNSPSEVIQQIIGAYPAFIKYFTVGSDYLPASLRWLPLAIVLVGSASLVQASWRKGAIALLSVVLLLGLMPIALRATYIINSQSFEDVGRIVFPYGFALLFFLLVMGLRPALRYISFFVTLILIYFCTMVATQETNAAYLKMLFDTNKINRIAERIENVVPDLYAARHPILVVGHLHMENQPLRRFANKGNSAHLNSELSSETFEIYRQPEILNFYFGRNVFVSPTAKQVANILPSTSGRRPWPAPESVYVTDNVVVVLLEENKPGVPITWAK